jgi:hypothetical protein
MASGLSWEGDVSVRSLPHALRGQVVALAAAFVAFAWSAPAEAASWFEKNTYLIGPRYEAVLPTCDHPFALNTIRRRFASKEGRFWNSNLQITDFDHIKETAFRPWAEGTIPRRFCSGRALISDGRWRQVHYLIIEDGGLMSMGWGVQWCVVGIDRNWAYNPACQMARP